MPCGCGTVCRHWLEGGKGGGVDACFWTGGGRVAPRFWMILRSMIHTLRHVLYIGCRTVLIVSVTAPWLSSVTVC